MAGIKLSNKKKPICDLLALFNIICTEYYIFVVMPSVLIAVSCLLLTKCFTEYKLNNFLIVFLGTSGI